MNPEVVHSAVNAVIEFCKDKTGPLSRVSRFFSAAAIGKNIYIQEHLTYYWPDKELWEISAPERAGKYILDSLEND